MKYSLYFLIIIASSLNAAQVGFNKVGYDTSVGQAIACNAYQAVAVDSKNRIVTVGGVTEGQDINGAIVRYNQDGTLDTSFNSPLGYFIIEGGTDSEAYYSVAIDSLDRIIVAGNTDGNDNKGLIARYKENGTLDTTFNTTGFVKTSFGNANQAYEGLARTLDNKFIAVGQTGLESVAVVARYLSNGVLDAESNWNSQSFRESAQINNTPIGLLSN
ncbi:MAG: hypothetical protein EBU90_19450 [Proteobacteria bacterium]|nr:hypothetical protein [Pseudomonadota bacterium]NBP16144.1 hypothetical protein [bacterium]